MALRKPSSKGKNSTKNFTLSITNGPTRAEIYHESEFCIDGYGTRIFRSEFTIHPRPCLSSELVRTCITGVEHIHTHAYRLQLTGFINLCFADVGKYEIYPFTAFYDAEERKGHMNLRIPSGIDLAVKSQ